MISSAVKELVNYGEKCGFLAPADRVFTVNRIIDAIGEDSYEEPGEVPERELHEILGELTDFAVGKGLCDGGIVTRDLFDIIHPLRNRLPNGTINSAATATT